MKPTRIGFGVLFLWVVVSFPAFTEPPSATKELETLAPAVPEAAVPRPVPQWDTLSPEADAGEITEVVIPPPPAVPKPLGETVESGESAPADNPPVYEVPPWEDKKVTILGVDRTQFPEMLVVFSVRDFGGKVITQIEPEFLEITEDEAPQAITSLGPCVPQKLPGEPLTLMLLIDSSGSMQKYIDVVQNAAARFVERLREDDQAGVVAFCSQPVVLTELTNSQKKLQKGIYQIRLRGFTALYDSVYLGSQMLASCGGRKAIILVTDGKDDDGTGAQLSRRSLEDVLAAAKKWKVPIFAIGLGHEISHSVMEKMGNETGGDFLFAPTGEEVDALYKEVARLLGRGDEGYFKATYNATADEKDGTDRTIIVRYENAAGRVSYPAPRRMIWPLSKVVD